MHRATCNKKEGLNKLALSKQRSLNFEQIVMAFINHNKIFPFSQYQDFLFCIHLLSIGCIVCLLATLVVCLLLFCFYLMSQQRWSAQRLWTRWRWQDIQWVHQTPKPLSCTPSSSWPPMVHFCYLCNKRKSVCVTYEKCCSQNNTSIRLVICPNVRVTKKLSY